MNKGIKVLLTSGYAGDVLERHRAVDEFPIIDKPFRLQTWRGVCGQSCTKRKILMSPLCPVVQETTDIRSW